MNKEDFRCVHDAPKNGCLYCAIGSETNEDVESKLTEHIVLGSLKRELQQMSRINLVIDQHQILSEALHKITDYIHKNDIRVGLQDCDDCNEILSILANAINKCLKVEGGKTRRKN